MNWFRRTPEGGFAWPGFGDNSRVLKWVIERIERTAEAVETPIGFVPVESALDVTGLELAEGQLAAALAVDNQEWAEEVESISAWYRRFGDSLPPELVNELEALKARLS